MKNGIAISVYLLRKLKNDLNTVPSDIIGSVKMKIRDAPASAMPIGRANARSTMRELASRAMLASPQLQGAPPETAFFMIEKRRAGQGNRARRTVEFGDDTPISHLEHELIVLRLPGESIPAEQPRDVAIELEQRRNSHHPHADEESVLERPQGQSQTLRRAPHPESSRCPR